MNIWQKVKYVFGWFGTEYHHVADKFHSEIEGFRQLRDRSLDEASNLSFRIEYLIDLKRAAELAAAKANKSIIGIEKMLAGK